MTVSQLRHELYTRPSPAHYSREEDEDDTEVFTNVIMQLDHGVMLTWNIFCNKYSG